MRPRDYAAFLPADRRAAAGLEPESTWWEWRGHRVHIARARRAASPTRVLVVHGAGGHSGALWPLATLLAESEMDVAAVDLPLYGMTETRDPAAVRYEDWVDLLAGLVDAEHDGRPLILLGASMGGLLACEAAARSGMVRHVVVTCLLDPQDWRARARMTRFGPLGILGRPLAALARGPVARAMIPMRWVANLTRMSRNPELSRMCATDPRGGGAMVPLGFLASYMRYRHTAPEEMTVPVTLTHPSEDAWTPPELSLRILRRVSAPTSVVMLENCGHFPIEEPGVSALIQAVGDLARADS